MKMRIITALSGFIVALTLVPAASADSISGYGTWNSTAPTTVYSEAGASWYFTLDLPHTFSSNPATSQVTDFSYYLNNSLVTNSLPGGILFFPLSEEGGFDLFLPLDSSTGATIVSLYFPVDVGSNLSLVLGAYPATIAINDGDPAGSGNVSITPEPPSVVLLGTAILLGIGFTCTRRQRSLQQ
jgi:hypothetical protein